MSEEKLRYLSRVPPLLREMLLKIIAKTVQGIPSNATLWKLPFDGRGYDISSLSVNRLRAEVGLTPHPAGSFLPSSGLCVFSRLLLSQLWFRGWRDAKQGVPSGIVV